jgi:CRP/FNR family cyclic AMP-dependent transcriptional regulator
VTFFLGTVDACTQRMELKDKSLLAQFQGPEGKPRLAEVLRLQRLVCDQDLALELARHVKLEQVPSGGKLIRQGASGSDLFLVLVGEFSVLVNGELVERRIAGEYVGEMALVDPNAPRSASVVAACDSVVARITEPEFSKLADRFPRLWRRIASGLSARLRRSRPTMDNRDRHLA